MVRIITGPAGSGKSTTFLKLYEENGGGTGLYSKKLYGAGNTITGYNLVLLPGKEELPFIRLKESVCQGHDRYLLQGRFAFLKEAFETGKRHVLNAPGYTFVWIDEIGKLELKGFGHDGLLRTLLDTGRGLTITVRDTLLDDVLERYGIREYQLRNIYAPK